MSGSGPYSGGGSDNESTGGNSGGNSGSGSGNPAVSSAASSSAVTSAADQVKSLMELQQHQLPGGYGLYRPPYGNNPGAGGAHDPTGFGGNRAGHLSGYPFAPMPGHNAYSGYHQLGYPTSQSPVRDGKPFTGKNSLSIFCLIYYIFLKF